MVFPHGIILPVVIAAACVIAAGSGHAEQRPVFDGRRALDHVVRQCAFGPRNPGSEGHTACLAFLEKRFDELGVRVTRQPFRYTLPGGDKPLEMTNLVVSFRPQETRRVLLAAHWDTRPWADRETDPALRERPIAGANDGASGVAVLLEVARLLRDRPAAWGVDMVLFDGEDLGTPDNHDGFFRGSKEFAARFRGAPPVHAILLDMVGDADLLFYKEGYSAEAAPGTLEWLWAAGRAVAPGQFIDEVGWWVEDDHLPLLKAGIPCVDLIDFDYAHWHTLQDTPDKVSAASLQIVGDVLVRLLYPD